MDKIMLVSQISSKREMEVHPDPFILDVIVDGVERLIAIDIEDLFGAVALGVYAATCSALGIEGDSSCPHQLRRTILDKLASKKVQAACTAAAKIPLESTASGPKIECAPNGAAALRKMAEILVAWEDEGRANKTQLLEPLPTFADFERATYGEACDVLAASAASLQPDGVEGNLWSQGEAEREAFVGALATVDAVTAAHGAASWVYLEIGPSALLGSHRVSFGSLCRLVIFFLVFPV